jgi:hypothetical protein
MSLEKAVTEIAKGVLGAVLVAKFQDKVPIANPKARFALIAAGGALLARKPSEMRSIGIGAAIASGTMLANEFMPGLLTPGAATVGRLSPQTQARMQAAADDIRRGITGYRQRTVVGTGEGGDFPVPVNGVRNRTIVGSGDTGAWSY